MKTVIFGATQGMGQALSRILAARGDSVYLLGRNAAELEKCAKDIAARTGMPAPGYSLCDLENIESFVPALNEAETALGGLEAVVVTAALFGTQPQLEQDLDYTARLLTADFANTVIFCEHARTRLLARGGGTLCVFSSVAGERGRKPIIFYGAAKAGLSRYLEGLDHKYHAQGLRVICVKPGFVKTGMTANLTPPPFAGEPDAVARIVVVAMDKGTPVVYAPPIWRLVMLVIRCLPRQIMRSIEF